MGTPILVSRQFAENFALVVAHYGCDADEAEEMRRLARADLKNAAKCFAVLAAEIRGVSTEVSTEGDRHA